MAEVTAITGAPDDLLADRAPLSYLRGGGGVRGFCRAELGVFSAVSETVSPSRDRTPVVGRRSLRLPDQAGRRSASRPSASRPSACCDPDSSVGIAEAPVSRRSHDLRHSDMTNLLAAGYELSVVARR